MSATTISTQSHTSPVALFRVLVAVLALAGILVAAFVIGRVTHGDGTQVVRSVTSSSYWPQVACHVGRPC